MTSMMGETTRVLSWEGNTETVIKQSHFKDGCRFGISSINIYYKLIKKDKIMQNYKGLRALNCVCEILERK